jgi:hypothetical protein
MNRHLMAAISFSILLVAALGPSLASAASSSAGNGNIGVSDPSVRQGGTTKVSGRDWLAGSTVSLALLQRTCSSEVGLSDSLGFAGVDTIGEFAKIVRLDASPGQHGIEVTGHLADHTSGMGCVDARVFVPVDGVGAANGGRIVFGVMLMIVLAVIGLIAIAAGRRSIQMEGPR